MADVAAHFANYLQAEALFSRATDATMASRWGDDAADTSIVSPLVLKSGADAESARQIAFLNTPMVEDTHIVSGRHKDKIGQVVTITIAELGYDAGVDVFVIGAEESHAIGMTTLTVLRRLT